MTKMYNISERLHHFMDTYSYTIKGLAREANIGRTSIHRWLRGGKIGAGQVKKIAAVFGIAPTQLARQWRDDDIIGVGCSGPPCGEKRALEIIGKDYMDDDSPLACHTVTQPMPIFSSAGRRVQR